jgi:hypothetical protein
LLSRHIPRALNSRQFGRASAPTHGYRPAAGGSLVRARVSRQGQIAGWYD